MSNARETARVRTARRVGLISVVIALSIGTWSCSDDETTKPTGGDAPETADFDAAVATEWFDLALQLTKNTPGYSPPVAARSFGCLGASLYEAVVPGMPLYQSLAGEVNGIGTVPTPAEGEIHWGMAANAALAAEMHALYPTASPADLAAIDALESKWSDTFSEGTSAEVIDRSTAFGRTIADAVFEAARTDGGHEGYLTNFPETYIPPVGEGLWVPTPPGMQRALQPYWGTVRPFLTDNVIPAQPVAPPPFSTEPTSVFYAQALEVYTVANAVTEAEETIARYWSDDPGATATPPGHSISIATQVLRAEDASLALAAETYAKLGMAVHDAFVSCWKAKYTFNLIRPITYINLYMDADWEPILSTPPFPEYTSGHSVQSGAAARVLSDLFGYNYAFVDRTHAHRTDIDGSPRSFDSFYDFADEAAISRLYGGIHYRAAIDVGVDQGIEIGTNIGAIPFRR